VGNTECKGGSYIIDVIVTAIPPFKRLDNFVKTPGGVMTLCFGLLVLTVGTFLPVLQGNFLVFDDYGYVENNPHVNSGLTGENILWAFGSFLEESNWHPLTWLSHMVDVEIYGLNPWGHHLTNVLLHAINTVLVFLAFRKLTGAGWQCLVIAMLFGLHPLRVEPVAWITARKDVLCATFWLMAIWTYARFANESKTPAGWPKSFYGLTVLFFALGLMSKQMVVTLPFVFLLLDFWPLNRWHRNEWRLILEKIPFFALAAAGSVAAYVAKQKTGALSEIIDLPFRDRAGNAIISYARYLGKLFWPESLCFYYPHPGHWPMAFVLPAGLFIAVVSAMAWTTRKQIPYLFVGWFWYLGASVPVIGLLQLHALAMSDCWTYIPLIGICLVLVRGCCDLTVQWRARKVLLPSAAGAVTLACLVLTRHQIGFWKDQVTVLTHAINVTKNNYVVHNNLGNVLFETNPGQALIEIQEAIKINPRFPDAYCSLGYFLFSQGQVNEAIASYRKALQLRPESVFVLNNLGNVLLKSGQVEEAIVLCQKAVAIDPDLIAAHETLGFAFQLKGRLNEALVHFQKVASLRPNNDTAWNNLGSVQLRLGRWDEAIRCFRTALILHANNAVSYNNLGNALLAKGQTVEAVQAFQQAIKLMPGGAEIHCSLGYAFGKLDRFDDAFRELQEALRLKPDFPEASDYLAIIRSLKEQQAPAGLKKP
jgi:protein O-mannosyl-transferase